MPHYKVDDPKEAIKIKPPRDVAERQDVNTFNAPLSPRQLMVAGLANMVGNQTMSQLVRNNSTVMREEAENKPAPTIQVVNLDLLHVLRNLSLNRFDYAQQVVEGAMESAYPNKVLSKLSPKMPLYVELQKLREARLLHEQIMSIAGTMGIHDLYDTAFVTNEATNQLVVTGNQVQVDSAQQMGEEVEPPPAGEGDWLTNALNMGGQLLNRFGEMTTQKRRADIQGNLQWLEQFQAIQATGDKQAVMAFIAGLNGSQKQLLGQYFETGGDPIKAAARMAVEQFKQARVPALVAGLQHEAKERLEWQDLGLIGAAQTPGFNPQDVALQIYHAGADKVGTDEEKLMGAIAGRTTEQMKAIAGAYQFHFKRDMTADIRGELSDDLFEEAQAALTGDTALSDAYALYRAMKDGYSWYSTGAGTDESAVKTVLNKLRTKSPSERQKVKTAYESKFGESLEEALQGDLSGHDLERSIALINGQDVKADAIDLHEAMKGGLTGLGTDIGGIEAVYKRAESEVKADPQYKDADTATLNGAIARRKQMIAAAYGETYQEGHDTGKQSALQQDFEDEEGGLFGESSSQVYLNALASHNVGKADAARLRMEASSFGLGDDDAILKVLQSQGQRAEEEVKRDMGAQQKREMQALNEQALNEDWTAQQKQAELQKLAEKFYQQNATAKIDQQIDAKASQNMSNLSSEISELNYLNRTEGTGTQSLGWMIKFQMSGTDQQMAQEMQQKGRVTKGAELYYGMKGAGTASGVEQAILGAQSPEEIAKIRQEFKQTAQAQGEKDTSLESWIEGDYAGREEDDLLAKLKVYNQPMNVSANDLLGMDPAARKRYELQREQELKGRQLAYLKERQQIEEASWALGKLGADEEMAMLNYTVQQAGEAYRNYSEALHKPQDPQAQQELNYYDATTQQWLSYGDDAVKAYRAEIDSVSDAAATVAKYVAAVATMVGGTLASILTLGTASPAFLAAVAAASALVGSGVEMGTKATMKGAGAYGAENAWFDTVNGLVGAATAAATAGLAPRLDLFDPIRKKFMENLLGLPANLATAAMNDEIWEGSDSFSLFMAEVAKAGAALPVGSYVGGVKSDLAKKWAEKSLGAAPIEKLYKGGAFGRIAAQTIAGAHVEGAAGVPSSITKALMNPATWDDPNMLEAILGSMGNDYLKNAAGGATKGLGGSMAKEGYDRAKMDATQEAVAQKGYPEIPGHYYMKNGAGDYILCKDERAQVTEVELVRNSATGRKEPQYKVSGNETMTATQQGWPRPPGGHYYVKGKDGNYELRKVPEYGGHEFEVVLDEVNQKIYFTYNGGQEAANLTMPIPPFKEVVKDKETGQWRIDYKESKLAEAKAEGYPPPPKGHYYIKTSDGYDLKAGPDYIGPVFRIGVAYEDLSPDATPEEMIKKKIIVRDSVYWADPRYWHPNQRFRTLGRTNKY
jgi:hypothetical protein